MSQSQKKADSLPADGASVTNLYNNVALTTSILGFLEAATLHASFWHQDEQLNVLSNLHSLLNPDFLVAVEATVTTIRNAEPENGAFWHLKRFVRLHDKAKKTFGALALRLAFARLLERFAALMVLPAASLNEMDTLPALLSYTGPRNTQTTLATLRDEIAELSLRQLDDLEEGSDYFQLGSLQRQNHAHALQASALTASLCCTIADDENMDIDMLLTWLEKILSDPEQSSNEPLGCAALQCLARLAKESNATASTLSRTLPQLLIHRAVPEIVGHTAADCLLYVLRLLSQDAVITTIWGLGNSLSATAGDPEKTNGPVVNGADSDHGSYRKGTIASSSTSSSIGEGYTTTSHNRDLVINAIVVIAKGFSDSKITALALSLLVQKMGRVTPAVDLAITRRSAQLACRCDPPQFKSLLRFYSRLIQDGVTGGKDETLRPVSRPNPLLFETYLKAIGQRSPQLHCKRCQAGLCTLSDVCRVHITNHHLKR